MSEKTKDSREGHRGRLRNKYLEHGLEKLTEAEVLELILSFGTPRRDCKDTARAMLKHFGSIRDVFEADPELIQQIPGAGPANIVAIKFIHDIAGKYLEQRLVGKTYLSSSVQVFEYLRHDLENLDKEVFKLIHLNNNNVILSIEDLSQGSITGAYVHPREVLERAIALRTSSLVFVHNHPSGNVRPSESDQRLTRRLVHVAYLADITVLDHVIVGQGGDYFSFKDQGLIRLYDGEVRETYQLPPRPSGGLLHEQQLVSYTPVKLRSKAGMSSTKTTKTTKTAKTVKTAKTAKVSNSPKLSKTSGADKGPVVTLPPAVSQKTLVLADSPPAITEDGLAAALSATIPVNSK